MAINNPYKEYQQQSVLTATPEELTLMLYNGCIKFTKQAIVAIQKQDMQCANTAILKAQDIVSELMGSLDMQYDISKDLMAIYDFIVTSLIDANIKKDENVLKEVLELMTELRDTWGQAIKITRKQRYRGNV
ncbi:MAG: flagellar export chaperone FliS [Xylanivirga thermophila]|jgi:flagellar secretion chaperone FliS|uniref:flagellar export chaperone FliS n=1 Tax=Xylanivirga thermophila TaxID=2496273 RepID=UPI00101C4671|nr:flagellar export chaperone FliS [Xylanivirga thermophila]